MTGERCSRSAALDCTTLIPNASTSGGESAQSGRQRETTAREVTELRCEEQGRSRLAIGALSRGEIARAWARGVEHVQDDGGQGEGSGDQRLSKSHASRSCRSASSTVAHSTTAGKASDGRSGSRLIIASHRSRPVERIARWQRARSSASVNGGASTTVGTRRRSLTGGMRLSSGESSSETSEMPSSH